MSVEGIVKFLWLRAEQVSGVENIQHWCDFTYARHRVFGRPAHDVLYWVNQIYLSPKCILTSQFFESLDLHSRGGQGRVEAIF